MLTKKITKKPLKRPKSSICQSSRFQHSNESTETISIFQKSTPQTENPSKTPSSQSSISTATASGVTTATRKKTLSKNPMSTKSSPSIFTVWFFIIQVTPNSNKQESKIDTCSTGSSTRGSKTGKLTGEKARPSSGKHLTTPTTPKTSKKSSRRLETPNPWTSNSETPPHTSRETSKETWWMFSPSDSDLKIENMNKPILF